MKEQEGFEAAFQKLSAATRNDAHLFFGKNGRVERAEILGYDYSNPGANGRPPLLQIEKVNLSADVVTIEIRNIAKVPTDITLDVKTFKVISAAIAGKSVSVPPAWAIQRSLFLALTHQFQEHLLRMD